MRPSGTARRNALQRRTAPRNDRYDITIAPLTFDAPVNVYTTPVNTRMKSVPLTEFTCEKSNDRNCGANACPYRW